MKAIFVIILVLAVVLGLGYWLYQGSAVDESSLPGQAYEDQGAAHIAQGSTEHEAYNSNPPTSGSHWPQAAPWGAYDSAQPDEQLIHNLEHGGIWISYQPSLDPQVVAQLKDFTRRYRKIIVAPREGNDSPIALAAWRRLQKLDGYNEGDILRFIEAFYDKGPEKVD